MPIGYKRKQFFQIPMASSFTNSDKFSIFEFITNSIF
jgi:hypothetical protein